MTLFLSAPLGAALTLTALLSPLSASIVDGPRDLAKAARKRGEALANATLADDPYRDKKRLCTDLDAYFDSDPPAAGDAKKAAKLVSKLLKRDSPAAWVWRIEELRGRLLLDVDAKGAAKAFEAALAAYPLERYPSPAKQSYFHHLAIDAALARWSATGIDDAEAMLESIAASDARLAAFSPARLEARYLSNGMGEPLRALYQRPGDALKSRLPAVAREIRARSIPDVRTIGDDPKKLFVVLGADRDVDATRDLVVVMPGGNGQARDFQNWIEKIATPLLDRYVFAILSAPRWSEEQSKNFVWVTSRFQKKYGAAFPVEEFARNVAAELRRQDTLSPSYS